jgi:4,5-DOPA dioxygenase extradiol
MAALMPVLFIGHGSPLNIILDNEYTRTLSRLGRELPRPKAVLVVSAHWLTKETHVLCTEKPKTIYDFYGFPDELYSMQYPCTGALNEARFVADIGKHAGITCRTDWGLDHASWAVLKHMYPAADVPVFELSLAYTFNEHHPRPLSYHYELAKELAPLRERGVLIIGSGNIVHNLGKIDFENIDAETFDWAGKFDETVKERLLAGDHRAFLNYQELGPEAELAVPTLDHYLPLIYAIALQGKKEPLTFVHEGFQYGSISMRGIQVG